MVNILIYPSNSLILSDLVTRFGHDPLTLMRVIRDKINEVGIDSPPINVTPEDPKKGLKYAAVDVPPGVRGRMALLDPLIEEADAAIIVHDADYSFGCMGCARTNELVKYIIRHKDIPRLELTYPRDDDEAREFVRKVRDFCQSLTRKAEVPA
ncbi:MAG TPA: methanogenesis marker 5 protein [Candidatus Bathyarchaeia archaeon]|nr:methanogenesis marker 5 protein [Candidatus Bathyarchaeia archaeon]HYB59146.1 methanogenesis marker 5 protein [Candidatus Acidoferrales bacterium]